VFESDAGRDYVYGLMRWVFHASGDRLLAARPDARMHRLESFVRRPPVTIGPEAPVADAAARMEEERVSSLLVPMRGGWGIVTDRDLRTKIIAARRSHELPVEEIATFPVRTFPASTVAADALVEMFADGVHHLPITDAHGRILGVLTDTDLMGVGRHTLFALRSSILRASDADQAIARSLELPHVVVALIDAGADPIGIGRSIALVVDSVTERLLHLGIDELGDPPASWAWLALGSAARREQALRTDQDHALAWEGGSRDEADHYFAALAERVVTGLEAIGIARCKGNTMATNAELRRPLNEFGARFRAWIEEPSLEHSVLASTGFDFRWVTGPLDAEPILNAALREARGYPGFGRLLARRALDLRPPTGFFRNLVVEARGEHAGRLDVKHGGITTITNLARAFGLRAGAAAKGTLARLDAAVAAGKGDPALLSDLRQAFRYLWDIRLKNQAEQVRTGQDPDDFVDPAGLGPFVRGDLKEAFHTIARAQRYLAADFRIEHR
jgi:CBS domain-containing protein